MLIYRISRPCEGRSCSRRHLRILGQIMPCCRIFLEKLIVTQLVNKFPAFYGTLRFITMFTRDRQWSLSSAICIQSIPITFLLKIHSNSVLSSHLRLALPSGLLPSDFPTNVFYEYLTSSVRAPYLAMPLSLLYLIALPS